MRGKDLETVRRDHFHDLAVRADEGTVLCLVLFDGGRRSMIVFNASGKESAERELEIQGTKEMLVGVTKKVLSPTLAESVFLVGRGGSFFHCDRTEGELACAGTCSIRGSKVGTSHLKTFVFSEERRSHLKVLLEAAGTLSCCGD